MCLWAPTFRFYRNTLLTLLEFPTGIKIQLQDWAIVNEVDWDPSFGKYDVYYSKWVTNIFGFSI